MAAERDVWRPPFGGLERRGVPEAVAQRIDEIAAAAPHYPERIKAREQVGALLSVLDQRIGLRRARDELHACDDGPVPASDDRRRELEDRVRVFRGLLQADAAYAASKYGGGCAVDDVALVGGITRTDVERAIVDGGLA